MATNENNATRDKRKAALSSVIAALFLTAVKLGVGLTTGSLGILSEAAHSGLDLMAAGMTFFAVRAADKPPDVQHHYGHGKFENISALFETLILLLTCYLIAQEAIGRLFYKRVIIEVNFWSYAVIITAIAVDYTRSRILYRAARKHNSQALEADALHFSTDILSSSVVIVGLIGSSFGVNYADPLAALGVSVIVAFISFRMGKKTIDVLVDRSPASEITEALLNTVKNVGGILAVKNFRARFSGGKMFVDMSVELPRSLPFEKAHEIMDEIERRVKEVTRDADVVVHAEPVQTELESVADKVRLSADLSLTKIHDIEVYETEDGYQIDLHLDTEAKDDIESAHKKSESLENEIRKNIPHVNQIFVHIDQHHNEPQHANVISQDNTKLVEELTNMIKNESNIVECHNLSLTRSDSGLRVAAACRFRSNLTIGEIDNIINKLTSNLQSRFPEITKVVIHQEPAQTK
ncbi:MAG: cation diffusion facilitator family transporter [Candidatus Kryptoniota bacterium]